MDIRDGETTIKSKFACLGGGGIGGREQDRQKRCFFRGKRHDDKIFKVSQRYPHIARYPPEGSLSCDTPCQPPPPAAIGQILGGGIARYSQTAIPERRKRDRYSNTLRWHVCRVNFARKIFFELRIFLRKMLRNFLRKF